MTASASTSSVLRERVNIHAGPNAKLSDITPHAMDVLVDICAAAGLARVVISSTRRYPHDQARVMYDNCVADLSRQRKLYAATGQLVIDVFVKCRRSGLSREATIAEMQAKIEEIGPYRVSHHAADPKRDGLCVFDVAPHSIPEDKHAAFEAAVAAEKRVARFFLPPPRGNDPGYHLEIPEPLSEPNPKSKAG